MPSDQCVVGIGEVLMDVFENGEATVGGAPFNVIFHLHQLMSALGLGDAVFLSALGPDAWGNHIRSRMTAAGMSDRFVSEAESPTGTALVFEHEGGAGFEIQSGVAWDSIQVNEAALELATRCDAVVFGSLAQRAEPSRSSIHRFVSQVRGHRLYDVNLRQNTRSGLPGYNAEIVAESLQLATVVKMNDAELEEVGSLLGMSREANDPEEQIYLRMDRLCREYSLHAIAVTRGPKGAMLATGQEHLKLPDSTLNQSEVHPVGAGDSFAAGLLLGIMQGWSPEESLELANTLSSWVVRHASATPPLTASVLVEIRSLADRTTETAKRRAS
jgi:fructokinase